MQTPTQDQYTLDIVVHSPMINKPIHELKFTKQATTTPQLSNAMAEYLRIRGLDPTYAWRRVVAVRHNEELGSRRIELENISLLVLGEDEDHRQANKLSAMEIAEHLRKQLLAIGWVERSGQPLLPAVTEPRIVTVLLPVKVVAVDENRFLWGSAGSEQRTTERLIYTKQLIVTQLPAVGDTIVYKTDPDGAKHAIGIRKIAVAPHNEDMIVVVLNDLDLGILPKDPAKRHLMLQEITDPTWTQGAVHTLMQLHDEPEAE